MGEDESREFDRWLTPADALGRLSRDWNASDKLSWMEGRLAGGQIRVRAASAVFVEPGKRHAVEAANLLPALWNRPWYQEQGSFWKTGDITFIHEDEWADQRMSFFDVRFDPAAFPEPVEESVGPDNEAVKGRPIPAAELERFAKLYLEAWGDAATEMKALTAIRATYPDLAIGRDVFLAKFRELRGPGRRGKPPIRGK